MISLRIGHIMPIFLLYAVSGGPLRGDIVTFSLAGVQNSQLTADVVFDYQPGAGTIKIQITNTSDPSQLDPRLTAFAFNTPSNVTGHTAFLAPSGWTINFDEDSINTPGQFGMFDLAALTGPNFNGGSPNNGVPRNSPFNFQITLAGSGLAALTANDFLSLKSFDKPGPPEEAEQYFIARFQRTGADGEGSDVAIPTGDPSPVPEISSFGLLTTVLAGLGVVSLRRRKPTA
jgi:hypothetical protein